MALQLSTPVKFVKRVGERVAAKLAERGVETVEDLLYHFPFRYEDRLNPKPLSEMQAGEMASLVGDVRGSALLKTRGPVLFELTLGLMPAGDAGLEFGGRALSQATINCTWFNGGYLRERFKVGQQVAVYGKLERSRTGENGRFKMLQPQFEILAGSGLGGLSAGQTPEKAEDAEFARMEMERIVPVYESLGGTTPWGAKLTSKWTRRVMWSVFEELIERGAAVEETLPAALRERLGLPGRLESLRQVHFPEAGTAVADLQGARGPGHRRLIFEELWYLELGLELKRKKLREREGTRFETGKGVRAALKQVLPFHPTVAQKRVLGEIVGDMVRPQPMRRLLQGDVGSGKTIVAMEAALVAIENGFQAALMAPTEILATQHYLSARKLLADKISPLTGMPYRVTLLTGSLEPGRKREAQGRIMRGETQLAIGTTALITDRVEFARLGLVVVDEQHRFGVQQRFKLMRAGEADPDVLVMTATPIPRTLALTVYGDMDVSVIDELPPGRTPIVTKRMPEAKADDVWAFVRKQVALRRQAYLVYPVIEGEKEDQPELDFAGEAWAAKFVGQRGEDAATGRHRRGPDGYRTSESVSPSMSHRQQSTSLRSTQDDLGLKAAAQQDDLGLGLPEKRRARAKAKLRSATEMYEELRHGALAGLRVGLLHGRMSPDDKEVAMRRFQRGETDVLVATTVIEVGVDVPNATVMVIDHAERFGLAQMHQLRGRVGRGAAKSYCILMTGEKVSPEGEERLDAMVRTQNGFELAELDLQQRGPGEFFGTRQAGMPEFRVASLVRDRAVLELAKLEAARFAEGGTEGMTAEEIEGVWSRLKGLWQRRYGLVEA